ncbi:aconitate hydratase AcnA [Azospirillum sp. SYSU D00513]|uniref:aconitate hydratase AcnA n=1 Tax=Azospirillum sp. SYSU D00513 TaxID=2812561 RepID=UPI0032B31838
MSLIRSEIVSAGRRYSIVDLPAEAGDRLHRLPWIHRILLENVLRRDADGREAARAAILDWVETGTSEREIAFHPGRVLMHDTTCGPALADIAAMRSALAEAGADPAWLNPVLPVDVSTDHSLPVDAFAVPGAQAANMAAELRRNAERYRFMKWATTALKGMAVHPPGTGIMHTINLERLATVVATESREDGEWAFPDTLIGTDSHTPMINGIGVLAWGVGGLEAESVIFGMPVMLRIPEVVGVRLTGALREGVLATDLALAVTERLRRIELSGRFVEFHGPGVSALSAGERAVVANMAPEYGASSGYFPIDGATLRYLERTGRDAARVRLVEDYARRQGLWFDADARPRYSETIDFDLSAVGMSLAGPRRPQDRISPDRTAEALAVLRGGSPLRAADGAGPPDGAVAIAAITSCTNTSDPRLIVAAGLLARKARGLGLRPAPWAKTSLAPGSPTAERYLRRAGLLEDLEAQGFGIVGYGCTTCIGNSGALTPAIREAMAERGILPAAVLSGNRNFPGRVHPELDAGFLASPPLVVAYALAGDVNRDILSDPLGRASDGRPVHLRDVWPSGAEIDAALDRAIEAGDVAAAFDAAEASEEWRALEAPEGPVFPWDPASTYIRRPPFATASAESRLGRYLADPILVVGDDITTDHISPVGQIPPDSDAGRHVIARGDDPGDLNVYASRRANWEVMLRGLFTNRAVRNLLDPTLPAGQTIHAPTGERMALWRAAERYAEEGRPVVIVAGERYGMGSSRDWAAKGVGLLNARAVLAVGFERIHRSNLVGMGILPLRLPAEFHPERLGLKPGDRIEVAAEAEGLTPRAAVPVTIRRASGETQEFTAQAAVETSLEVTLLRMGGIFPLMLARAMGRETFATLAE